MKPDIQRSMRIKSIMRKKENFKNDFSPAEEERKKGLDIPNY